MKNKLILNFLLAICQPLNKKAGSVSVRKWYGSADPDQNITDPQRCPFKGSRHQLNIFLKVYKSKLVLSSDS